ncbi:MULTISPECIES: iron ABC transporter permease [unclassified Paenibacillus]|uniref:ABC transporter permease n=1 Tax=unclassified Paenibacillus TaxID=185978 RepID=UPI000956F58D|nr:MULTISPECIES: iron ABC transporter permease [unclassified Paenibacillus]ASS65438.1 iron ABC transporter permease [Paenibacillus sp. RUD330]SIQ36236.1 iron(III) transport system permease protein [Paenibacillus sp. RU4X]SIQ58268.1 iron(III) transport system permease protein [Paenibacillus sp. RU4T]
MAATALMDAWKQMKKMKQEPVLATAAAAVLLITAFFVLWPIAKVVSYPHPADYMQLFTNSRWLQAARNSLMMTVLSTFSCTAIAFLFAFTVARLDVPLKGLFRFVTLLPIVSPPFIVALSYILLFGRQGLITRQLLHFNVDIYGWHGLWLVQTITFFPYAYAVIYGVLQSSAVHLEYAAHNLGATRWQAFRHVFLPLCRPGIAGGALITAMNVLADFGNPMIIGGNFTLLPTEAYMQMSGWFDLSSAAVLSTALLLPALGLFLVNRLWVGRSSYITVTGRESSLKAYPASPPVKWILFACCLSIALFILAVYGVLVYGAFTKTWGYDWSFTLDNLNYVTAKQQELYNSISYALLSSIGAAVLGIILAYIVHRKRIGVNRLLDFLAILPGAVPGVFLGLGFALTFNQPPLQLGGTSAIMILALMFWNLPTCYSACSAGFQQIGRSLEDASHNLGAGSFRTLLGVLLPLLKGPFLSGMSVSFLRSVTCLSVIIFLYSVHTSVGTVSILGLVQSGAWGGASAFTVVLISIAFAVLALSRLIPFTQDRRKR